MSEITKLSLSAGIKEFKTCCDDNTCDFQQYLFLSIILCFNHCVFTADIEAKTAVNAVFCVTNGYIRDGLRVRFVDGFSHTYSCVIFIVHFNRADLNTVPASVAFICIHIPGVAQQVKCEGANFSLDAGYFSERMDGNIGISGGIDHLR